MSAFAWLQSKSQESYSETLLHEGKSFTAKTRIFHGRIPAAMKTKLRKEAERVSSGKSMERLFIDSSTDILVAGFSTKKDYALICRFVWTHFQENAQ